MKITQYKSVLAQKCFSQFGAIFEKGFFIDLFWERWMKHSPLVYADPPHTTFDTQDVFILRPENKISEFDNLACWKRYSCHLFNLLVFLWSSVTISDHLWSVIIFTSGLSSLLYKHGARQEWQVVKLSSLKKVLNTTSWKYWGTLGKKQNGELSHVVADTSLIFGDTVVRWSTPAW